MSISIDGTKIIIGTEEKNRYDETRKRVTRFYNNYSMSDREIIEKLAEEIEQYRSRISKQEECIKELNNKTIQSEEIVLHESEELLSDDIAKIETITMYAEGKVIETITKYEYK